MGTSFFLESDSKRDLECKLLPVYVLSFKSPFDHLVTSLF